MGYGGQRCFNGAKNWYLGWYDDKHKEVSLNQLPFTGKLSAFLDYSLAKTDENVVVKLGTNHYLQYSHKDEVNAVGRDAVTVATSSTVESPQHQTRLLAEIDEFEPSFTITDFEGAGSDVVIELCSRTLAQDQQTDSDVAMISIFLDDGVQHSGCPTPVGPVTTLENMEACWYAGY